MKKLKGYIDIFVISGFITSFFYGFLNPLYVSAILSRLDVRVIAMGSFMSSAFPVLIGAALGRRRVFDRMFTALPVVMVIELAVTAAGVLLVVVDLAAYYLLSMFIMGVFSASVIYLLQKLKQERYRRNRAAFDRRSAMADALGSLTGSAISVMGVQWLSAPLVVAAVGVLQTVLVYGLFLILYRKVPATREKEPHPCAWREEGGLRGTYHAVPALAA